MASSSSLSFDYDGAPSVLIFGDDAAGIVAARAAAEAAGARVAAALPLAEAVGRLALQSADAVAVELAGDAPTLDALLDQLDTEAADGRPVLISMPASMIDPVAARIDSPAVRLLCDPAPGQRAGELALMLADAGRRLREPGLEEEAERLARLGDEVGRIARALAEMAEREPHSAGRAVQDRAPDYRAEEPEGGLAAETVRRAIRMRRLREHYFEPTLFADPAWDMLLDLMAARLEGQRVAVSSLCIAAAVPATTALRWIRAMTDRGLFVREADPHDARRVFIALSDRAAAAMAGFFEAARKLEQGIA